MMPTLPWQHKPTLDEALSENEQLEVQLSIEQKKAAIRKLKQNGLTTRSFGDNWAAIRNWLRTH